MMAVTATDTLMTPDACAMLLVDFQAGLGFGVESASRQVLLNNAVALARTAAAFGVPVVVSTSASYVYSGPLLPAIQDVLPAGDREKEYECLGGRQGEECNSRDRAKAPDRRRLPHRSVRVVSALSALDDGFDVFVVADACAGLTLASHELALRRLEQAGACLCSWIQVLLEFQRDWTRHATYDAARAIVVANGGGYGMGLAYAREMIHPT
jgi:nicotinamidase-related amidase